MAYSFSVELDLDLDAAITLLGEVLAENKMGIVSDVNVSGIIKNKLDADMPSYRILGACNPGMAKRVIESCPSAGTLLPCNIIARTAEDHTILEFMNPVDVFKLEDNADVQKVADEAVAVLENVKKALEAR